MIRTTFTILSAGVVAATIGTAGLTAPAAADPASIYDAVANRSITRHFQANPDDSMASRWPGGQGNRGQIVQHGRDNSAGIGQNGRGNLGIIRQRGNDHSATLQQNGNNNSYAILQYGRGGDVDVTQTGNGQGGATFQVTW